MQGPLLRDVALVAIGNTVIAGRTIGSPWPGGDVFRFSAECVFRDKDQSVIAADPNAWFERLRGFDGLWLDYSDRERWVSDRMTQGFVGGGHRWLIGAVRSDSTELWEGGDRLGDRNAPDGKIWESGYVRLEADWKQKRDPGRSVAELRTALDRTLIDIEAFARGQKIDNFADLFAQARNALTAPPRPDPMLMGAPLPDEAAQLWSAIGSAWVFGGMGSWNDMGFDGEDGKTYETLSDTLFEQLNEAVAAVANSTWPK
ncbi:MAG TPA: hypothetical protein VMU08_05980 [Rhizomicrobium sp.]|nr:hypothetical protein [Rhizomicrobium sp.]